MPVTVTSMSELRELISTSELLLLMVYDSSRPDGRYLLGLMEDIARVLSPPFTTACVDAANTPSLARSVASSIPRIMLFFRGKKVWEQIGFFYNSSSDKYAIRRGILLALRNRGYKPSDLGLRLTF